MPNSHAALTLHLVELEQSINSALRLGLISRATHAGVSDEIALAKTVLGRWGSGGD